jgi:hypothetical protein
VVTTGFVAGDVFVGRGREVGVLHDLLAGVKAGVGGVVLVGQRIPLWLMTGVMGAVEGMSAGARNWAGTAPKRQALTCSYASCRG